MEQSSLSLASDINAEGVYHVGWPEEKTEKVLKRSGRGVGAWGLYFIVPVCFQMCLQNMVQLTIKRDPNQKRYKLEELLELQNKLMLMSTKGERGVEQVRRFTEVSDFD